MSERKPEDYNYSFITCAVCGNQFKSLTAHIRVHGMTVAEYREEFGVRYVLSDELRDGLSQAQRARYRRRYRKEYKPLSRAQILARMQQIAEQVPGPLTSGVCEEHDPCLAKHAMYAFGSWTAALAAAGLPQFQRESWSKERIIRILKGMTSAELQYKLVRQARPRLCDAAGKHFGSWGAAVTAAGHDYEAVLKHSRRWRGPEDVVEALRVWSDRHGTISARAVSRTDCALYSAIYRFFSSMQEAAAAGNLPYAAKARSWSREDVLKGLRTRKKAGRSLQPLRVREDEQKLYEACLRYFGTFDQGLQAIGVDPSKVIKWCRLRDGDVVRELREWSAEHGPLSCQKVGGRLYSAARRHFGSLKAAADAAGVPYVRKVQDWSADKVIDALRQRRQDGRPVDQTTIRKENQSLDSAIQRYWGSY